MPLIRRGKLLAGVAAFCALSVAGAGCRTSDVCKSCSPAPSDCGCSKPLGMGGPAGGQDGTRVTRMSFPIRARTTLEPGIAQDPGACQTCMNPTAVILRPVPLTTPAEPSTGTGSTWTPVQRVSAQVPAGQESDLTPVASLGTPILPGMMTNTQAPAGEPLLP